MYTLVALRSNLARMIGEAIESKIDERDIEIPPDPKMGDLAFPCFKFAKEQGKNPAELAKHIVEEIAYGDQSIASVKATGPYVNIFLKSSIFVSRVIHEIDQYGERYGTTDGGAQKQVMLEYANLNSHKEFHVGHLRNILYGLSIHRLLDFAGWQTVPVSYINDMGSHVAKCLWLFVRQGSQFVKQEKPPQTSKGKKVPFVPMPEDLWASYVLHHLTKERVDALLQAIPLERRTGKYLGEIYAEATKLIEENEEFKEELSYVQAQLEAHEPSWNFLWQETRRWSLQELFQYLQSFGVVIKRQYLESEFIEQSKQVVSRLMEEGIAIESDGAIIIDLDAYPDQEIQKQKLGVFMLRKSDGNLLYATKDIPLAEKKLEEYPNQVLSLLVVDTRQSHYFEQLFTVLKIMGYRIPLVHLGYEFVTLPEGAMSSRKGTVIPFQDFIDQAVQRAQSEIMSRHQDWNDGKVRHTAWCIALGGIMFAMLKQDPEKILVFEMEKALGFEGDTGPYVQYALTRINSILEKSKKLPEQLAGVDVSHLEELAEKRLAFVLAQLPEVCARAAQEYKPSLVASWCLDAAAAINAFYRDVPVLEAPDDQRDARLRLILSTKQAVSNALFQLGIPVPDAM